jgi:hypothetical protein
MFAMRRLTKFLALPAQDRWAFAASLVLLCVVRLCLWIVPFRWLRAAVRRVPPPPDGKPDPTPGEAERTAQAIESAARSVPGATCLTQALAAEILLRRAGHPAAIHVGVAKTSSGELAAHAWIEAYGRVLLGDHELDHFTPLHPVGSSIVEWDPRSSGPPKGV